MIMGRLLNRAASRILRGPTFRSDRERDIFLASYPRSGNTWLRAILFHARIGRAPQNLGEIDFGIPDEHQPPRRRKLLAPVHPTERFIVKTHQPYRLRSPYQDVVCVVRDPRDVIPSYFRYLSRKKEVRDDEFEDFAIGCISGAVWPGSWFEHVASWQFFRSKHPDRICIFTYERLVALDAPEIERLGKALLLPSEVDPVALFRTYDLARMRALEGRGNRPGEPTTGFIGEGRASTSRREVVEATIQRHAPQWSDLMTALGYAMVT